MRVPKDLYPFDGKRFDVGGGLALHYLDEGHGDPVVMVHGNPTWSFYYRNLVVALRGRYRAIAPDHVGCGLSDKPQDDRYDYTLARRIDDLTALLEHLGVHERVTLVLHDWGGMIGMGYAVRYPERVRRLVLLNTAAFALPASKPFPWPLWLARTPLGTLLVRRFNAFARTASRVACTRGTLPREVRDAYCAPYDSWDNRIATLRFVQDIPLRPGDRSYDVVSRVAERLSLFEETPTLIAWGLRDFVFDAHFLAEWRRRLPHAQIREFADAGHYVLEDAGAELIPLITEFLAAHPLCPNATSTLPVG